MRFGSSLPQYIEKLGNGSFNATKTRLGLAPTKPGLIATSLDAVLPSLAEWYGRYGSLPTRLQAIKADRLPRLPTAPVVLKACDTSSWPEAMRRAATLLDIHGGRYGLPGQKQKTA